MPKNNNSAYVLLDRSGSMASSWVESVNAINQFVTGLPKSTKIQITAFDAPSYSSGPFFQDPKVIPLGLNSLQPNDWYKTVRTGKVKDYKEISTVEISPRGMTALNDSLGLLLNSVLSESPEKAVIVVMTDGHENASKETSAKQAKDLIQKCKDRGYEIVWLGADFNEVENQASSYGLDLNKTMNTSANMRAVAYQNLSAETSSYFETGKKVEFSAELKAKVAQ
jgi:hypothetical protein